MSRNAKRQRVRAAVDSHPLTDARSAPRAVLPRAVIDWRHTGRRIVYRARRLVWRCCGAKIEREVGCPARRVDLQEPRRIGEQRHDG